ncbi:L-asparaginase II [Clostridium luticellarii]|uniref:L-asparaginase II n=2 Tax=Clostridium luticellarii TaxID=1691940 RepID=A0A2T0BN87_9CLOT|nr:L-asparaginase II [Clostridium luticellarii]
MKKFLNCILIRKIEVEYFKLDFELIGGIFMSEIVVKVTRGSLVESIHRADIAVVNSKGNLVYSLGDSHKVAYMRSAAKPIQTMEVILSGASERFSFTDKELSIMCGSHYGEEFHRETVEKILNKIGLNVNNLLCGSTLSLSREYSQKLLWEHAKLNPTYTDCSGKHAGILSVCVLKGYNIENYNSPEHPVQKEIKTIVSEICSIKEKNIVMGTDGCTVPVFGMPLYNMALGYSKIASGYGLSESYKKAADRIFSAVNNAPEMVAGTNGFCTEIIKNTHNKIIGKFGAEGIYCIGVRGADFGIAIKIEDGGTRAIWPTVVKCLEDLNVLDDREKDILSRYKNGKNLNNVGEKVGNIFPDFTLKKNF